MADKTLTFTVTQTDDGLSASAKGDASVFGFASMLILWESVALKRLGPEKTYAILELAAEKRLREDALEVTEEHVE